MSICGVVTITFVPHGGKPQNLGEGRVTSNGTRLTTAVQLPDEGGKIYLARIGTNNQKPIQLERYVVCKRGCLGQTYDICLKGC